MLLKIVTDEELLTSQIVKTILLVVLSAGIIYNLFRVIRSESKIKMIINSSFLILLSVALILVFNEYRVEAALLKNPLYVQGITLDYCSAFARGEGIEFEYEVNGIKYSNCNTFHPVSKDSIVVPGGKYMVRFSLKFPEAGRMNFRSKAGNFQSQASDFRTQPGSFRTQVLKFQTQVRKFQTQVRKFQTQVWKFQTQVPKFQTELRTSKVEIGTSKAGFGTSKVEFGTSKVGFGTSKVGIGTSNVEIGTSNVENLIKNQ